MRLREMQGILRSARPVLNGVLQANVDGVGGLADGSQGGRIPLQRDEFVAAVRSLRTIPALTGHADAVLKEPALKFAERDHLLARIDAVKAFKNVASDLMKRATDLADVIGVVLPAQGEATFAVRLPELLSLNDLTTVTEELQEIFDVPARKLFGDGVAVTGFDTGSMWVELTPLVHAGMIGVFTVGLANAAYRWASAKAEKHRKMEEALEITGELSEMRKQLKDAIDVQLKALAQQSAVDLVDEHAPAGIDSATRNDSVSSTVHAITALGNLYFKSVEVQFAPALTEPMGKEFPSSNDLAQLAAGAKALSGLLTTGGK